LHTTADKLHSNISLWGMSSPKKIIDNLNQIDDYNKKLTLLENNFSGALAEGSRWLEHLILKILLSVVLTVEGAGILLGVSVSLTITSGIKEIIRIAGKISAGNFSERAIVYSKDEIGLLALSFNKMIDELEENVSAIKEGEEQLQTIFKNAPDGIVVINEEGTVVKWNPMAEVIFGWTASEVIGRPLHKTIIPERFREAHKNGMNAFSKTKAGPMLKKPLELPALRKDNKEIDIRLSISPTLLKGNHFFIGFMSDISFRKNSEALIQQKSEELIRSNKELEQFAYAASHDLQEPLRIITSYIQLLEKGYKDKLDDEARIFINFTVDAARRMHVLINDLLAYSRVGFLAKEFEQSDINVVIKMALENLKISIVETNAKIKFEALPTINADLSQMTQLFQNIIGNAIKFSKDRVPEIIISAKDNLSHWLFSVSDNGIGIQKEYLDKIFVIFQRLHSIAEYPGTGIGLAICKKIVERHGGKIWAESEIGKGTTFYFTIKK
ncbi:MAG TPA: ATP-binding protein, partial [Bacteroidia bacterium]|nr:ATP-binding protein [Bacteroidia bacterium]